MLISGPARRGRADRRTPLAGACAGLLVVLGLVLVSGAVPARADASLTVIRDGGADRYATAVATTRSSPTGDTFHVDTVFVVNGGDVPDALAAGAVTGTLLESGSSLGVVLPVMRSSVPALVEQRIRVLDPLGIVVVGGPAQVSDEVLAHLRTFAPHVRRVAGADRYATAVSLAVDVMAPAAVRDYGPVGAVSEVVIASGTNPADAFAGSVYGSQRTAPVLLATPGGLPPATLTALRSLQPKRVLVLGGETALAPAVADQVRQALPGVALRRLAGRDRYDTAAQLAQYAWSGSYSVELANGEAAPDALYAVNEHEPALLLSRAECLPAATVAAYRAANVVRVTGVGGPAVLSDAALAGTPRHA